MNKNIIWKLLMVLLFVFIAFILVWPPHEKLKPGIDLAGGTSLIYDIDTKDLSESETKDLAQNIIPILLRRVDPTNVANIVMRPLGDTRIEIQLPVASVDTHNKRQAYEESLQSIESQNIDLRAVKAALTIEPEKRQQALSNLAAGSESKLNVLNELAQAYDSYKQLQNDADSIQIKLTELKSKIDEKGLRGGYIENVAPLWIKVSEKELEENIKKHVEQNKPDEGIIESITSLLDNNKKLIADYIEEYKKWAETVNRLADPETGKTVLYKQAMDKLVALNFDIDEFTDILSMPVKSIKRQELIDGLKVKFPAYADAIDHTVFTYAEYSAVGGRLDDPEDLKRMLRGAGVLEFRILPTVDGEAFTADQIKARIEQLQTKGPKLASDSDYKWFEIEDIKTWKTAGSIVGDFGEKYYVLASNKANETMLHTGQKKWKLKRAKPSTDEMGRRAIGFLHDEIASTLFFNLTKNNVDRPLCILLDDVAISAPNINEPIRGSGIISGEFSQTEVDDMVNKLNAGSLDARLSEVPVSEKTIGPIIGADNRNQGVKAGLIGLAAVAVFMVIYYMGPGLIAVIALLMNILFILAMMVLFRATFTLPGIAGIILTIGMSVDANVLIFERIREEQDRGSSLRMAIANGYQRAFRTIFDANITTFIVAAILYMVASEEIKGFAIVLMLGIASSMFTALFVTRAIFDFLVSKRIIRDHLTMLRMMRNPSINWMGMRSLFILVSFVFVAGGMFIFFTRDDAKNSKYDIEFTGGTSVQVSFKEGTQYTRSDVERIIREKGSELNNPGLQAAKVYSVGESGLEYEISTTETNKTTATVAFSQPGVETVETVQQAILTAAQSSSGTLYNLNVFTGDGQSFSVSTSQVNKGLVKDTLDRAFEGKATVSEPVVNELVNQAVKDAFARFLAIRENLGLIITSTEKIDDTAVELAQFTGGVKIVCQLESETTHSELVDRLSAIRFKTDTRDLPRYDYKILDENLSEFAENARFTRFVYVSADPEAAYRQLSEQEFARFTENEVSKLTHAASLETSLSRVTQIDPSIGQQSKTRALIAIIMSLIAIVAYIWIRFGTARYGFAAIAALVHDVCITLGAVTVCTYIAASPVGQALLLGDFKIDLAMIAALLTIIGYSLNDTIVVFDRIRENRGKLATVNPNMISNSINQTLSRTLLTSLTTFIVVFVMYIWGGAGLRGFTFAMLVGIVVGTYSSIAIASLILIIGRKTDSTKLGK